MTDALLQYRAIASVLSNGLNDSVAPGIGEGLLSCCRELLAIGEAQTANELLALGATLKPQQDEEWGLRFEVLRSESLMALGDAATALTVLRDLRGTISASKAPIHEIEISIRMAEARALGQLNRVDEGLESLQSIRQELLARPDSALLARCALNISTSALLKGDAGMARRYAMESIVSARRSGALEIEALAMGNLGLIEKQVCRWPAALEAFVEKERISLTTGQTLNALHGKHSQSLVHWKRGDLEVAARLASQCRTRFTAIGNNLWVWYSSLAVGLIDLHKGDYGQARATFVSGPGWKIPDSISRPSLLTSEFLGDIHLEQGDAVEALRLYDEVFPKAMALVPKGDIVAELRRRRAECYLLLGRTEEAYTEALTGLEHCRELGDRYEEAATYRVLALAAAALGNAREARQLFEQGFSFYEDIETPFEWGKLWMSYGDWLSGPHAGESRDLRGALEAYVVAREHFERMGAGAKLAMVNAKFQGVSAEVAASEAATAATRIAEAPARRATRRAPARSRADRELDERAAWAVESFGIITRHRPLLHLLSQVEKLSKSRSPVLILGESGTGKELVAKAVHRLSGREAAYLPVNCGAIPRELMESELFGHMSGAFTGAHRDKPGLFEVCDKGTVFLDEIGEMTLDLQSKLLRFLETGETRRVGATRNILADVRIVAATNRERAALEKGQGFRVDLYYRLAHAVVELPPLRARGHDAELLVDHFLQSSCASARKRVQFSDDAMDRLIHHSWPGNVRQLKGVIEHAVLIANDGDLVGPEHLQLAADRDVGSFEKEMEMVERRRIEEALRQHRGSKAEAARSLRMPRTTFLAKMKRYGML